MFVAKWFSHFEISMTFSESNSTKESDVQNELSPLKAKVFWI